MKDYQKKDIALKREVERILLKYSQEEIRKRYHTSRCFFPGGQVGTCPVCNRYRSATGGEYYAPVPATHRCQKISGPG